MWIGDPAVAPMAKDLIAMFGWFKTGRYVADPRCQTQVFGAAPTPAEAVAALTDTLRTSTTKAR